MVVKTFRGLLEDGGQDQIRLGTNKGKVGYRIVKFQALAHKPGSTGQESTIKLYKTKQTTINNTVDFSDSDLLGTVIWLKSANIAYADTQAVIFDNEIFNQDIYVTHFESDQSYPCNYYLELEVIPLTDHAAEYATLKDIRTQRTIT